MACLLLWKYFQATSIYTVGSLPLAKNAQHSPTSSSLVCEFGGFEDVICVMWASVPSDVMLTGTAHTIQRQHAHKIATSVDYIYTAHYIEGICVSLRIQKGRMKRRHDYPDAEVETERGVPHSLRRRRKIVAALKLPRPESVETEIEERGVWIQKARRKRRHDYPARR